MDLKIAGLRVMVSAGASGIGLAIARAFVREGAKVSVCDVDQRVIAELAQTDPEILGVVCDVSNRDQVASWFEKSLAHLSGLDCLVNNAGIAGPTGKVHEIDPAQWDRCLAVDLTGQFNCVRMAVPALKASKNASILNLSSLAGRLGFALRTPYAAAKWGVIGLMRSLAVELGPDNIRVNALLPGIVAGQRQIAVLSAKAQARGISFEEVEQQAFAGVSIKQYVTPEQLADYAVYLASPTAATISGQALSVCGDTQVLS